jgi:hypothetical protein
VDVADGVVKMVAAPSLVSTAAFLEAACLTLYALEDSGKLKGSSLMRMQRTKVEIDKGLAAARGVAYTPPPRTARKRTPKPSGPPPVLRRSSRLQVSPQCGINNSRKETNGQYQRNPATRTLPRSFISRQLSSCRR